MTSSEEEEKSNPNNINHFYNFYKNRYLLNSSSFTKNSNSHTLSKTVTAVIVSSGASNHYRPLSIVDCINTLPCHENMQINLPNKKIITPTHTAYLNLPNIPRAALKTYLFPDIPNKILLSLSQFYDHGYKIIFDSKNMCVFVKNKII